MARALWSGAISFGLVNVPVKLFKATTSSSAHSISFHQIHERCGTRIQHMRHCPTCNVDDVPWEEVVKGYEFTRGQYAIVREEELPKAQRGEEASISIEDFVDLADVDPVQYDRSYWVVPDGPPKAYALLYRALSETGRVAIARVMLRTRAHLATVRARGQHLVMETMFFADELVAESDVPAGAEDVKVTDRELDMAKELIDRMTVTFDPGKYRDAYSEEVRELIDRKIADKQVAAPGPVGVGGAEIVDIMDALRRSLAKQTADKVAERASEGEEGRTDAGHGDRDRAGGRRRAAHARAGRKVRKSG